MRLAQMLFGQGAFLAEYPPISYLLILSLLIKIFSDNSWLD
jgi:hypothetical protein